MQNLKACLLAVSMMLVLSAAIATAASARNLSLSNRNFRIVWAPLAFSEPNGLNVRCNTTVEGSFHSSTITKVARTLIGYITRANVAQETCRDNVGFPAKAIPWNGTEVILGRTIAQSLPWHVTYEAFTGTLPNITGVRILLRNIKIRFEIPIRSCLATYGLGESNLDGTINVVGGEATSFTPGTISVPLRERAGECPDSVRLANNGVITLLGTTTRIRVTLI